MSSERCGQEAGPLKTEQEEFNRPVQSGSERGYRRTQRVNGSETTSRLELFEEKGGSIVSCMPRRDGVRGERTLGAFPQSVRFEQ